MHHLKKLSLAVTALFVTIVAANAKPFNIVTPQSKVCIVYAKEHQLDSIAAYLLAADIERVSGYLPQVYTKLSQAKGNAIIIGSLNSALIKGIMGGYDAAIKDTWERYSLRVVANPAKNIRNALVIAGSDLRGTAYGVFSISEKMGVTPWYWWADATPQVKKNLVLDVVNYTSASPSVKYRGIFINDEDWGLQPWAAKTFEPETKDIGPKTYAKVFELLLRLKANLIWPAMHPSTKAFYSYPGNKQVAADYQIVVGSSHAEPMLRNNVGEWNEKTMGHFNYVTNKDTVYKYWETRVKESSNNKAMYTIGMRGVHDSGMEGVKSTKEAIPLIEKIFDDQRGLMQKYVNRDATKVPQVFTIYKEVLDIYEAGLKVPEDVTLVWPDDNYGYIQRLSSTEESKRSGGSGVYYHASYWGRPHDYLWLSTTHPALIREEMTKAYTMNARNVWVLNVGDIKPAEYDLQLFADMAYNVTPFMKSSYSEDHMKAWMSSIFGAEHAGELSQLMWDYYQLAFERRPEFMGWSQTEPTTQTKLTAYDHGYYGDRAQQRIDAYSSLQTKMLKLGTSIPARLKDAYYELIQYSITGATLMNKKFLYHDKAILYAAEGRLSANDYKKISEEAYAQIIKETDYYNNQLAGGKWKGIMSMQPRNLPVYQLPPFKMEWPEKKEHWSVYPEGYKAGEVLNGSEFSLPAFDSYNGQRYFVDIALMEGKAAKLQVLPSASWIKVSDAQINLWPDGLLQNQKRVWISIDWHKVPPQAKDASLSVTDGSRSVKINIPLNNLRVNEYDHYVETRSFIDINVTKHAVQNDRGKFSWAYIHKLGSAGVCLQAFPLVADPLINLNDTAAIRKQQASVSYSFINLKDARAAISIYTLPTSPLNKNFEMRYAVSIDGGPLEVVNFKTVGRSEEWKQNVLSNSAVRTINTKELKAGRHMLTIYQVDPGVILDRIFIDLNNVPPIYGAFPHEAIWKVRK